MILILQLIYIFLKVSNNETKQQKFKRKNKLSGRNKLTGVDRSSSSESLSKVRVYLHNYLYGLIITVN